jgi:predicted nucleotidyltransferase
MVAKAKQRPSRANDLRFCWKDIQLRSPFEGHLQLHFKYEQDALATLRRHESALRARGVAHAAVFGSVVRGDNRAESDLDILVEFELGAEGTIYDYKRFKEYVATLFQGPVDVIAVRWIFQRAGTRGINSSCRILTASHGNLA